ncbi:MAG TPA: helix-turn-helix transcriptional regulator [Actinoplanes sp.]|jgi:transcriptional regulator with XRE-family HTH domain|nr:helix-turn-helix transcriptional regulator [Actinoplanes sp.]
MRNGVSGTPESNESLGRAVARMRKAKGLTGTQLAGLVGTNQPKISRLENDIGFPDQALVRAIAHALGADEETVDHLVKMADLAHDRMTDWRPYQPDLASRQQDVRQTEAGVQMIRIFQPALIPGLLQTSEYARAVLSGFQRLTTAEPDEAAVAAAVSGRITRQEILTDRKRSFHFVMTEQVLSSRIAPPEHMPAQLQRIREVARQPNASVSIVPADAVLPIAPVHGFEMLDEDTVVVDVFNTGLSTHGKSDNRLFRQVFEMYEACATADIGPILDRHLRRYLELLEPGRL